MPHTSITNLPEWLQALQQQYLQELIALWQDPAKLADIASDRRFAVEQGHHTFILSWRNPDANMALITWDDYVEHGIITAMQKVLQASGAQKLNVQGFCVGGHLAGHNSGHTGCAQTSASAQRHRPHLPA